MTRRHLYLLSLWLPLMLLVVISISEAILKNFWWHQMSPALGYFLLSGMMGGLQYLLFAAGITWRFARMDIDFLNRMSWVLPIMFFPVCFMGLWVFFQLAEMQALRADIHNNERAQQDILAFCIRLGMYSVAGGYLYVGITHLLASLLIRAGFMQEE